MTSKPQDAISMSHFTSTQNPKSIPDSDLKLLMTQLLNLPSETKAKLSTELTSMLKDLNYVN